VINYINGDLFSTKDKIILHGCNTLGKMGAGVALQMRQKYPKVYRDYKKAKLKLGNVVWSDTGENLIVGNCLIQETIGHSGTHINYIALRDCMKQAQILVSKLRNNFYIHAYDRFRISRWFLD